MKKIKILILVSFFPLNFAYASEITGKLYTKQKEYINTNSSQHIISKKNKNNKKTKNNNATSSPKTQNVITLGYEHEYINNLLYRDEQQKIYYIKNNKKIRIYTLFELQNWRGKKIYDIKNNIINKIPDFSDKLYKNNDLIRTPDMKIYEIRENKLLHITSLKKLQKNYFKQQINNISFNEFNKYPIN